MSHRNRAKPSRVRRWEGTVKDFGGAEDGDSLWCEFRPLDHHGPELFGEIPRRSLPNAERGTVFNVYRWRKGRKSRYVVRERDLGHWTAAELEAAQTSARALAALLASVGSSEVSDGR